MRARSAHLMTSWWVVGVWAALGILTGVISVITALQPTWYVRYTLIHAQALPDVTFQVVVSSVGPLGFCRLTAVETHQVVDDANVLSIFKKEFSTPSNILQNTRGSTTRNPVEDGEEEEEVGEEEKEEAEEPSRSSGSTLRMTPQPPKVIKNHNNAMQRHTEPPSYSIHTSRPKGESLKEWTPFSVQNINSSIGLTLSSLAPPPGPTVKDAGAFGHHQISRSDGIRTSEEVFQLSSTTTDKSITEGKSEGIGNVLFKVTEKYVNVVYEGRERPADNREEDYGPKTRTVSPPLREEKGVGMSGAENSITEKSFVIHSDLDTGGDSKRQDADDGLKFTTENATGVNEFHTQKNKKFTHISNGRRNKTKKKNKKQKKKKKKRKMRNKNKRKNRLNRQNIKEFKGRFDDSSSTIIKDIILTPMTEVIDNSSSVKGYQSSKTSFNEEEIIAEYLIQQNRVTTYERNTVAIDYQPRSPIMMCSGVSVGVGSGSSAVWVLVGVVYGVAGVVQVMAGVASIMTQAVHSPAGRYAHAIWVGNVQVAVVMAQGVTLILFPLGLGSPLARVECGGSSSVYWPGDCTFGWSYMLAIVATTLAAYCPCLARLTVYKRYALREWESLNFF